MPKHNEMICLIEGLDCNDDADQAFLSKIIKSLKRDKTRRYQVKDIVQNGVRSQSLWVNNIVTGEDRARWESNYSKRGGAGK